MGGESGPLSGPGHFAVRDAFRRYCGQSSKAREARHNQPPANSLRRDVPFEALRQLAKHFVGVMQGDESKAKREGGAAQAYGVEEVIFVLLLMNKNL